MSQEELKGEKSDLNGIFYPKKNIASSLLNAQEIYRKKNLLAIPSAHPTTFHEFEGIKYQRECMKENMKLLSTIYYNCKDACIPGSLKSCCKVMNAKMFPKRVYLLLSSSITTSSITTITISNVISKMYVVFIKIRS